MSLADRKVNDRLIILRFLGKTLTSMLPLGDTLVSVLYEGLLFFCEIFFDMAFISSTHCA